MRILAMRHLGSVGVLVLIHLLSLLQVCDLETWLDSLWCAVSHIVAHLKRRGEVGGERAMRSSHKLTMARSKPPLSYLFDRGTRIVLRSLLQMKSPQKIIYEMR